MSVRWELLVAAVLVSPTAHAQAPGSSGECADDGWGWGWPGGSRARVCEVRELTLPRTEKLSVAAGPNGSILVTGDNRRDVSVRARVQAWARDEAEAQRMARAVVIRSDGVLRAEGPSQEGRSGWSVSYEVLAPRQMDLSLETNNGGITVTDVRGELVLETANGGISLDGVAGNVRGRTTNGGVDATLTGDTWDGEGLELKTTNGGVRLRVPDDYSARLETSTVNGGVDIDFPVTVQGLVNNRREIRGTIGSGGPPLRVATTNGGVQIRRR